MSEATCASCGETKELCESGRIDGLKQPRFCRECLIELARTGVKKINDFFWMVQIGQLNDAESISILLKMRDSESANEIKTGDAR